MDVIPIYNSSGTRIKIIEAFACRRPVISTTIGIEGIEATDRQHYLKADSDKEFVDACIMALKKYEYANNLANKAYALANSKYSNEVFADKIREII